MDITSQVTQNISKVLFQHILCFHFHEIKLHNTSLNYRTPALHIIIVAFSLSNFRIFGSSLGVITKVIVAVAVDIVVFFEVGFVHFIVALIAIIVQSFDAKETDHRFC